MSPENKVFPVENDSSVAKILLYPTKMNCGVTKMIRKVAKIN
jgi:hypothetical protein